jgi:hypothetical protein
MEIYTDRKEVVAACMESPFYFGMPLKNRLELIKQVEQRSTYCTLRQTFLSWIKAGILSYSGGTNIPELPDGKT